MVKITLIVVLSVLGSAAAQEPKPPQVRLNIMNVCTPPESERGEIATALARVPEKPQFSADFEISRGRSTLPDQPVSDWVRVRQDLTSQSPFSNVQYSFSSDSGGMVETLVLRMREGKDLLQMALEDHISGGASTESVLQVDTPVSRVTLERFGKPSIGLARCPKVDQTAYEPMFLQASRIMARYRQALEVKQMVPAELAHLHEDRARSQSRPKPKSRTRNP